MKIVWICHFTNSKIQNILKPWRRVAEFAPWISDTIPIFENLKNIEFHLISPHEYIAGIKEFKINNVIYHFFNPYIPIYGRHWPWFFKWDYWTDFSKNKKIVRKLVDKINPDIIHLQGAENPYYSVTALQFIDKYPFVVNLQKTSFEQSYGHSQFDKKRAKIEMNILQKSKNVTVRTKSMIDDIRKINSSINIYWVNYAMSSLYPINIEKKYDIVFFARVSEDKGIFDILKALKIIKGTIKNISLCIIGSASKYVIEDIKRTATNLDISNNIVWIGYLPSLEEVHIEASKARISVLPTHWDVIPGTIIESMQLGLPVVSYKAGSIPELNEDRENVLLSEIGDIEGLAHNIIRLLTDDDLYNTMRERGIDCIKNKYNNKNVFQQHLDCYHQVIEDFRQSKGNICRQ